MIASLLLGACLIGVVDQVDAGWASVEWAGRAFGFVRVEVLPEGTGEGDCIVLRRRRHGGVLVELPQEVAPHARRAVRASIHPCRGHRGPSRSP